MSMLPRDSLQLVLYVVYARSKQVHERFRVNEDAHALVLHQLIESPFLICR